MTSKFKLNLELYDDVLRDLMVHGPLQISNIMENTKIDGTTLKKTLDFLLENSLVEERQTNNAKVLYAITGRGSTILNWFRELDDVIKLETYAPT